MTSVPLRSYRGTRFNILFNNSACGFFLHKKMRDFLETVNNRNRLLLSILHDLKTPEFVAGCKALGLICKLVTSPLWSVLEDNTISIINMNEKYLQLVTFLEDASRNIPLFMAGEMLVFGENTYIVKDAIFNSLIKPDEYDNMTEIFLEVLLLTLCECSKKLFKDHLPGGALTGLSDEMSNKVKHAPKTSSFAESVFGQLDHLLRTKPNISTLAAEACIMSLNNKTTTWLNTKSDEEKCVIMKLASKSVKILRHKYKERLHDIAEKRRITLYEQVQKKEAAKLAKLRELEQNTKDIISHGLWQSELEIDNMLQSYSSENEKSDALKKQLKFRKNVLQQVPSEKTVFNLTKTVDDKKSRKKLTVEELTINLKSLVKQAIVRNDDSQQHILVGKRVRHRFTQDGHDKWYTGKVISQVPSFPDWFNIVYDSDSAVYTYHHLEQDIEKADLQILV